MEQWLVLLIGGIGFLLARWQYTRNGEIAVRQQAVCGVYYAEQLAGRDLEDWEVSAIAGGHFSTRGQYLDAKEVGRFIERPFVQP